MGALYLLATIAGRTVALAADKVLSVVEIDAITPVPRVAAHIAGLATLRSRVLTMVDCRRSLGLGESPRDARTRVVVVAVEGNTYGLLVDDVLDAVTIATDPEPVPATIAGGWARAAGGIVAHDGAALLLLDPAMLVQGPPAVAA